MTTIICPCERKKVLPVKIKYDAEKKDGINTIEVFCPFCEDLLTVELPGNIDESDQVFRGIKKNK